ncbi:MAG: NAD(P)/FAD-dependent oxidoreductase [Firmicutes bacterium]|nr:NAD(P)/FAD-dependent oxidoreductase [Bacillota bacterium]
MYHTVVIGAGQAGLAMGYYLRQNNSNFILLEKGVRAGNAWENRYDSLKLFTPRMYSSLPGLPLIGDKHGFPSKDEMASYLHRYAAKFSLPIQFGTEIIEVTCSNDVFTLITNKENITTKNVVVATGAFHIKYIPPFAGKINERVLQLHSSDYKNPAQLREGSVLVVGGGNSGAQIAVELSSVKNTYLSIGNKLSFLPLVVAKKSMYWWFDKLGLTKATNTSFLGKKIQQRGDPIFGLELKKAIKDSEVTLKGRVVDADENHLIFLDQSNLQVDNIIWSTGFKSDFSWLHIPGLLSTEGKVIHKRGVTNVNGLYFVGLPWQYRRGSSLLQGVGEDAKFIRDIIHNE